MSDYAKLKMDLLEKMESGEALTQEDVLLAEKVAKLNADPLNLLTYTIIKQKVEYSDENIRKE